MTPEQNLRKLKASPMHGLLKATIQQMLDAEREQFENMPASDYSRGRVSALKELLAAL